MNLPCLRSVAALAMVVFAMLGPAAQTGLTQGAVPPLALKPITVGQLTTPVSMAAPADGSNRLFVCEQTGQIRVIQFGSLLPVPFLDISARLISISPNYDERGLLGLAFHPGFGNQASPGYRRFYVFYSAPSPNAPGTPTDPVNCRTTISEFQVTGADPNVADPNSERVLLAFDKPQSNHNGGELQFGPDGLLYISVGDGGSQHDNGPGHTGGAAGLPTISGNLGNAQDTTRLMGKLLRIDPLGTNGPTGQYGIPPSNPLVGMGNGVREEIYAFGFRNPWRFSFDDGPGGTLRMYEADVGQDQVEEINLVTLGGNFGWRLKEGTFDHDNTAPNGGLPLIDPIAQYAHLSATIGNPPLPKIGCSVTGGYVYRGKAIPELVGKYVFADWSPSISTPGGTLLYIDESVKNADGTWTISVPTLVGGNPTTTRINAFGRDEAGELYLATRVSRGPANDPVNGPTGAIYKLIRADVKSVSLSAAKDNTIYSESNSTSNAKGNLFAGRNANGDFRRALLAFDLTGQISAGSSITAAQLTLHLNQAGTATPTNMSLYRLSQDWGEGTSGPALGAGAPATAGDATWADRFFDPSTPTLWSTAGGSFSATVSATTSVGNTSTTYSWSSAQMAADVQTWLNNPAANFGWILVGDETAQSTRRFDSRESAAGAQPSLLLTAASLPAPVDPSFDAQVQGTTISAIATQPDGRIIVGGLFTSIGGLARSNLARLNSDGGADPGFQAAVPAAVLALAVQPDGKMLVAGSMGVQRLLPDGTPDPAFTSALGTAAVACLAVQADRKLIVGGPSSGLARLNADGTLDASFSCSLDTGVNAISLGSDGRLVIAGGFSSVNGVARAGLARVNADGSVDEGFVPPAPNGALGAVLVQPDNAVIIGGAFTQLNGASHPHLARLAPDGTIDSSFAPAIGPVGSVQISSIVQQANGALLISGDFHTVAATTRNYIARLTSDGALDYDFDPDADAVVNGLASQADGRVLAGGDFSKVAGVNRPRLARFLSASASTSLSAPDATRLLWQRNGSAPETQSVTFELSTDGGVHWSDLGVGSRTAGGWELRGLALPTSCQIRARARTTGGRADASAGLVEATLVRSAAPAVTTGGASGTSPTSAAISGTVDANNADASVVFEYGLTAAYGSGVSAAPSPVSGDTATSVSATLANLTARTTYHYRVKATNSVGTAVGDDATFTTPNTPPVANSGTLNATNGRPTLLDLLPLTSDAEGDARTIFAGSAQHGTVTVLPNGIVSYLPNASYSGTDTLTYLVSDGFGGVSTGTVTITVPARPNAPVLDLLALKGGNVPGAGVSGSGAERVPLGSTWLSFGLPAINDAGEIAFLATVKTPTGSTSGIFSGDPAAPTLVAIAGDPAPGAPDTVFASFKDPVLDQGGAVAFQATLANAPSKRGVTKANNQGLWTNAYPGGLALVARTGDHPVDGPPDATWTSFQSFALAEGVGGPLFVAKMSGGGVKGSDNVGLWGAGSTGHLRLLLREGQSVETNVIRNFTVLSTVLYSPGQTRSFSRAGDVVVRATFTDGKSGLVRVTLP